ncbi:MAG: hypothetical protein HY918_05335 [Candidatus Doudnabacteria bacterium]|nr:hypothetical protein [Candidatus Doudnabacteria bacterium]
MSTPSVYINLEDDVSKIVTRLKHQSAKQIVLVCPKRCFLFNDSINLRLLKKQTDMLGKEIFILTMDERGQLYAKEAGFGLKFLPKSHGSSAFSDVKISKKQPLTQQEPEEAETKANPITEVVGEIKHFAQNILPEKQPVKRSAIVKSPVPKVATLDRIFENEDFAQNTDPKAAKSKVYKSLVGLLVISVMVILVVYFLVLPKATVVVYPKSEPVTRDMEISLSSNIKELDPSKLVLPATAVSETVNVSHKYESQGKKQMGNKASGMVKIYNFTKLPINLKTSTTILTVGSKTYSLVNDVSGIKPTSYSNAKTKEIDQSSLGEPVEIVATSGGDDFNLPAGTRVEITNQVFGSNPQLLYAKTETEISGGTTRYLSVISQDDVDKSKEELLAEAMDDIKTKLAGSGQSLADKSYTLEVLQFTTDNQVGTETPSFQASMQIKVTGLAYATKDLKDLITQRIGQTLASNKSLVYKDPESTTVKIKSYDATAQLAVLNVHFEGQAVFNIELPYLAPELVGKSKTEVYEILKSKAEIDRVDMTLAPSWQKKFPYLASKIKVTVGE